MLKTYDLIIFITLSRETWLKSAEAFGFVGSEKFLSSDLAAPALLPSSTCARRLRNSSGDVLFQTEVQLN